MIRNNKITLSVDCMGGDNSIDDILGGVNQFCSENNNDTLLLHGDKNALTKALDRYPQIKKMCKKEKDFKELLHVSQYPIPNTVVKKRNEILAEGGIYPNGK